MKTPRGYVQKRELSRRGWNKRFIDRFLRSPDLVLADRSGEPVELYELGRVSRIECSGEFSRFAGELREERQRKARAVEAALEAVRRSLVVDISVDRRKSGLVVMYLERLSIDVPVLPKKQLIESAVRHYNALPRPGDRLPDCVKGVSFRLICRVVVNFLRHQLTCYEAELRLLRLKLPSGEGYWVLKGKVLLAIAAAYPWLRRECELQLKQTRRSCQAPAESRAAAG
jgi:hypothetical protein